MAKKNAVKESNAKVKSAPAKKVLSSAAALVPSAKRPARKVKPAQRVLSAEERARLLKPRTDFEELMRHVMREWAATRELHVPGITRSKFASLLRVSDRAEAKEQKVRERYERQLAPLADARRVAHSEAYRALLLLRKAVKLHTSVDPGVGERFAFLQEALRNKPSVSEPPEPKEA